MGGYAILLDCENAANNEFMERVSGIDLNRLLRYTPETLEKVFRTVHVVTKRIRDWEAENGKERMPITFVYDSITVSPCERELKENDLPLDYKDADWKKVVGRKEQPGERAKICGAELRKLTPILEQQDVTFVVLNQIREKIGVMYGSPETTGGGGRALEFYASLRCRLAAKKKIEDTKLDKFAGVNLAVKNVKNRTFRPFVQAEDIKLYFDNGIDPLSGILACLRQEGRIILSGNGNYTVSPECLPEDKTEYKFKASKVSNTVKEEVLYDCPKLIDCETAEDVKTYLQEFTSGMAATASGDFEEKDVAFDVDGNPVEV
jgi:RecA/RadA recombinase